MSNGERPEAGLFDLFGAPIEEPGVRPPSQWRTISSAPADRPIDLWIGVFDEVGMLVKHCWWNGEAAIPDWYCKGEDGEDELAARTFHLPTHWKPAGSPDGPCKDGGPPLHVRTLIPVHDESWPDALRARFERYREAVMRGEVDRALTTKGMGGGTYVIVNERAEADA